MARGGCECTRCDAAIPALCFVAAKAAVLREGRRPAPFQGAAPALWERLLCVSAARSPGTATQEQHAGERCGLCFAFPSEGFFGCVLCPFKSLGSLGEPERIAFSVII